MKLFDDVKVINDNEQYQQEGVYKGMIGTIIEADIKWNEFYVCFQDQKLLDPNFVFNEKTVKTIKDDICAGIKIKDLELVKNNDISVEKIRKSLPEKYPDCWCKVEDGFIMNLKGDKKNKIPYDYNS